MADHDSRSMSIVPYSGGGDVVLRHDDAIVVFDPNSQQLVLKPANQGVENIGERTDCPYCHRPLRDGSPEHSQEPHRGSTPATAAPSRFVNPEYFRLLENTIPPSTADQTPPSPSSPRRQLVPPGREEGTPVSASEHGSGGDGESPSTTHGISSSAFSHDYFKRFFVEERELGRGGKGVVLLVKHILDGVSLGHYACKRVPVGDDHEWLKKVLIEVQLLQHLSHQNLVSYRHVWLENARLSNFGPSVPCAFILQQYCNAGDLQKYICGSIQTAADTPQQLKARLRRRSRGQPELPSAASGPRRLQLEEIYSFFKDITSGLRYLHVNGYIHRDLKPSNCLLHETGRELRVLVSDFGEVQFENTVRNSTGTTGTISFCAPEVLRRVSPGGPFGNFSFKSDVFSLGMILYFLCFGQLPYRNADVVDEDKEDLDLLRAEISRWAGFDAARRMRPDLPDMLYSFLTRLLDVNPDMRPTAEDVLTGIQTGGSSGRFHRTSPSPTDLQPTARVLPVDSPATGSPSRRSHSPVKRAPPALDLPSAMGRSDAPVAGNSSQPMSNESEGSVEDRSGDHANRESTNLLVRSTATSPRIMREYPEGRNRRLYNISNRLLLPPPSRFPILGHILRSRPIIPILINFTLLTIKIISLTQLCAPLTVKTWIVYPLLFLAVLDLSVPKRWLHVAALLIHALVLALALKTGSLCAQGFHDLHSLR
ncbi:IKS protein kinase [Trichophyton interdigitale MR816]|uniref:non-specific serine/threonine protein kinase n=1 Tax=Trichophyton interdigitale (strain MR816) TaxID=1215338 RepID=A0A059JFW6_TRIIM|nr:IKS protein kinase [Trichophyton interdigitale H6]KDB26771.1 IKS protein kinase [Trichophyton interdigitale MR816]